MLVVEFQIDSPILQEALAGAPETTITHEELYQSRDSIDLLFWAKGEDLATFDDCLAPDPTVTNPVQLAETGTRRLYRVTYTEYGASVTTIPTRSDLDISLLDATASQVGWDVRIRLPDRDALENYIRVCDERDLQFRLQSIYEERDAATQADAQLTNAQREALLTARELGYFEIPRRASLADVADKFGVSSQAISERIRRGTTTLVDSAQLSGNA